MMYKKLFFIFSLALFLIWQPVILSNESLEDDILSGLFYEGESILPTNVSTDVITRSGGNVVTVDFLTRLGAQDILRTPLYLRTSPIMRVPLLDLPMFQVFVKFEPATQFEVYPFYTQTYSEHFYKDDKSIDSYVALDDPIFITAINRAEEVISQLSGQPPINIPTLLPLFKDLKTQERRTGFMNQFVKNFDDWSVLFRIPVYYQEHNLFLTPAEQKAINDNPFFAQFTGGDYMEFARQHLICDAVGVGDTRINMEFFMYDHPTYKWGGGFRFTIPTAFALKKGLYGSAFPKDAPAPDFDLNADLFEQLLTTYQITDAQIQQITNYSEAILDRLSTMLLSEPMGNGRHFGIGLFSHGTMVFSSWISLGSLTQIELVLPASTSRFFYLGTNLEKYQSFDWSDSTVQVSEKISYLNSQLQKKFFPPLYKCTVFPGLVLQNTTALTFEGEFWNKVIGSDLWFHTKESLTNIQVPLNDARQLDIDKSSMGGGYQAKIWASIERNPKKESYWIRNKDETRTHLVELSTWTIGLRGEAATNSYTVGGDWGISVYIKNDF